jgi:hypothetical protein
MELQQLKLGDKVKLQLIQPQFKCSGREEVTCFYKGKIIDETIDKFKIEFKYKGKLVSDWYHIPLNGFLHNKQWIDIKIVK